MPIIAGTEQGKMKFAIEPLQPLQVRRIEGMLSRRDVGGKFGEQAWVVVGGGFLGDQSLEGGTAAVKAENVLGREYVNTKANRVPWIECAIPHQFAERLSDRSAADAQPDCYVAIFQARASGRVPSDQGRPEMLINLLVQRGSLIQEARASIERGR
jgi:hypothetical protein